MITPAFDVRVQNELERFHLVRDLVKNVPSLGGPGGHVKRLIADKLIEYKNYIDMHGEDVREIRH